MACRRYIVAVKGPKGTRRYMIQAHSKAQALKDARKMYRRNLKVSRARCKATIFKPINVGGLLA